MIFFLGRLDCLWLRFPWNLQLSRYLWRKYFSFLKYSLWNFKNLITRIFDFFLPRITRTRSIRFSLLPVRAQILFLTSPIFWVRLYPIFITCNSPRPTNTYSATSSPAVPLVESTHVAPQEGGGRPPWSLYWFLLQLKILFLDAVSVLIVRFLNSSIMSATQCKVVLLYWSLPLGPNFQTQVLFIQYVSSDKFSTSYKAFCSCHYWC